MQCHLNRLLQLGNGGWDEGSNSNYGKSVGYKSMLKDFLISTADVLHLGDEEKGDSLA